jgi:hypothetical protein
MLGPSFDALPKQLSIERAVAYRRRASESGDWLGHDGVFPLIESNQF